MGSVPLIVKYIYNLFEAKYIFSVVNTVFSAISKYYRLDKDTSIPIGQHSLVSIAKKAFWQQRPPIPRYCGTYDVTVILKHIKRMGENKTLTLKQLLDLEKVLLTKVILSLGAVSIQVRIGENEILTLKQLSEKTAFLVVFSTLSRYGLVPHLTKMSFPKSFLVFISP